MKNRMIKGLLISIFAYFSFIGIVMADSAYANIGANRTSCTEGESVTITVNVNAGAWELNVGGGVTDTIVGYTPIDKEGNVKETKTYTFSCSSVGSHTITLSGNYADYDTEQETSVSQSVTITVNAKPQEQPTQPSQPTQNTEPSQPSQPSTPSQPSNPTNTNQNTQTNNNKETTTKKEETKKEEKKEEPKVDPIVVEKIEIAGFNINFSDNVLEYTLELDEGVEKLYIETKSNATTETKGLIDIKDKTEIKIVFKKDNLIKEYTIKFTKKNGNKLLSVPQATKTTTKTSSNKYKITTVIFAITTLIFMISTIVMIILKFRTKKD